MDLDAAIALLDTHLAKHPDLRAAWLTVRGTARRGRRISSTTLPAVGAAAQHASAARDSAQRALEALGGVVDQKESEDDPSDR